MYKLLVLVLLLIASKEVTSQVTYPYKCDPNNRPSVCTMEYTGVCGWNDSTIQCFAYPCAQNYATACAACSVAHVEKVTLGNCPAVGTTPASTPTTTPGSSSGSSTGSSTGSTTSSQTYIPEPQDPNLNTTSSTSAPKSDDKFLPSDSTASTSNPNQSGKSSSSDSNVIALPTVVLTSSQSEVITAGGALLKFAVFSLFGSILYLL